MPMNMRNQTALISMKPQTELRPLVNKLVISALPSAINRGSFIINDIPDETFLDADENVIALIFGKLLENTINSSHLGCIRITARQEDDYITVSVKDNNSDYSRYISGKMVKVAPLVKKIGGEINFEFNQRNNIKIVLNFISRKKAA